MKIIFVVFISLMLIACKGIYLNEPRTEYINIIQTD
ncbi:hypothetical protein M2387_002033 [Klebsiella sp. BIGb0407]|nr:hypothetical protein [Klebsiella sp. BIGb0407]